MSFDSNSLQAFCQELGLNTDTCREAEACCKLFLRGNSIQQPLYLYTAAALIATLRTKQVSNAFVQNLFKNLVGAAEFTEFFKAFVQVICPGNADEALSIVEDFSFAWRLYKKFLEKWAQLELEQKQGHSGSSGQLRDVIWVLIAIRRLQMQSNDLVENACLLLAAFYFALNHLPMTVSFSSSNNEDFLLKLFNADSEQFQESCSSFETFLACLKSSELLRCGENFEGIFAASHIHYNHGKLIEFYVQSLKEWQVSEVEFLKKVQPKTPIKQTRHRKTQLDLKSKRIISWDTEGDCGIKSKLGEIPVQASPSTHSFTPMSSAMELSNWIREIMKKIQLEQVPQLLEEYNSSANFSVYAKIESFRNRLSTVLNEKENLPSMLNEGAGASKSKSENILKLYVYALHGMLKNEQKRQGNLNTLYNNENFHQATFACAVESIVFAYGLPLNFEQVLSLAEVSIFEFWKIITTFVQFDSKIPISLKKHFRDVENHIINESAWTDSSAIHQLMAQFVNDSKSSSGSPIFNIFFKRLLSYLAQKLVEVTEQVEILEEVKERIWELIKNCITEHLDLLNNRTLDTIVLCSIYAVCKVFKPVSFKTLIENFSVQNPGKEHVFKQVAGAGDIIKFYNLHFIPRFKEFLSQGTENLKNFFSSPLRASLPITSPSRVTAFCSPKTPYLTPRTRKLWASSEGTQNIVHKKGRLISFDDEPQLPKIEEDSPVHRNKK